MNKKYLVIGISLVVVAGVAWLGRMVYRARHNLVSLDVYGAPIAAVVKQIERQTGETILAGKDLDVKVTLSLKNVPLDEALDQLGEQAGANWSKWHAVHGSTRALDQLETALRERTKLAEVGWTNLVTQDFPGNPEWHASGRGLDALPPGDASAGSNGEVVITKRKPVMIQLNSDDIKNGDVEAAVRDQLKAAGADDSTIAQAGAALRQTTVDVDVRAAGGGSNVVVRSGAPPNRIRMITRTRDGSGRITEEVWSPQNLVLEQRLHSKLGGQTYAEASEAIAREVAEKAKASLTTVYLLRKSPGSFSFGGKVLRRIEVNGADRTNHVAGEPPAVPDLEAVVRRAEAENYTRLTPEQRVQRAREKLAARTNQP